MVSRHSTDRCCRYWSQRPARAERHRGAIPGVTGQLACLPPASDLGGELGAGGSAQLGGHVHKVSLDRPPGDKQPLPDLRVGQPVGNQRNVMNEVRTSPGPVWIGELAGAFAGLVLPTAVAV